jgi:hypothetical protein
VEQRPSRVPVANEWQDQGPNSETRPLLAAPRDLSFSVLGTKAAKGRKYHPVGVLKLCDSVKQHQSTTQDKKHTGPAPNLQDYFYNLRGVVGKPKYRNQVQIPSGILFSHKKANVLSLAAIWMELVVIMLSKIS